MRIRGYVVLDSTWARYLGVRRSGGIYRIARRELLERLKKLQLTAVKWPMSSPAVPEESEVTRHDPPADAA